VDALVTAVSAVGGLVLGDELEIVVDRLGQRQSLARPWWRCETCQAPARGLGLVPVARVVVRRGGCPSCAAPVSHPLRPAVLAVVSALVLGGFAAHFGADVVLAAYAVFGLSMVAISAVDLERYIIPNHIIYPTLALLIPLFVVASAVDHRWGSLGRAAIAGAVAFIGFLVLTLIYPAGMGFGDVRLAGVIGLALGWLGLGHAFVGFFAGFVLGAVIGIIVIAVSGGGRKTKIPFGPFLAAGAVLSIIWGTPAANALFHRGGV
jgi:leader peptidase (prepilin peptidase) / N-methyltransferase